MVSVVYRIIVSARNGAAIYRVDIKLRHSARSVSWIMFASDFNPRDAMRRAGLCESDVFVRPSARSSVCYSRYCIKTERDDSS